MHDIFAQLTTNDVILTVNRRLSRWLRNQFDLFQVQQQKKVWTSVDILPLPNWLERCWLSSLTLRQNTRLLSPLQEKLLWQDITAEKLQRHENYLLPVNTTAQQISAAWQLCSQWLISLETLQAYGEHNKETDFFVNCAKQFQQYCQQHNFIDASNLAHYCQQLLSENLLTAPQRIYLAGFDEINPQLKNLLSTLQSKNCSIHHLATKNINQHIHCQEYPDHETEIHQAALWCRQMHEKDPHASIYIVVPDLENYRQQIENIFTEVLQPQAIIDFSINTPLNFNISLGNFLADYPLIASAMLILQLNTQEIPLTLISNLLRSPFIRGGESEMIARAQLDLILHNYGKHFLAWETIDYLAQKNGLTEKCNIFLQCFANVFRQLNHHKRGKYLFSEWCDLWKKILHLAGWPGERTFNGNEIQLFSAWQEVLEQIGALDHGFLKKINYQSALKFLDQHLSSTIFQPETPDNHIHIVGLFESVGINADYMWIMHLIDETLPPAAHPHPLLPYALQQKLNLPNANPTQIFNFYSKLFSRLLQSSSQITLSYHRNNGEKKLLPSALIKHYLAEKNIFNGKIIYFEELFHQESLLDEKIDQAVAITKEELKGLKGGSSIFKNQAACPFRAFALHRLHAEEIGKPYLGYDAKEKGTLLHHALEQIWQVMHNSSQLAALTDEEINSIVNNAVDKVIDQYTAHTNNAVDANFCQLEKKRLNKLITHWLTTIERNRLQAFEIHSLEYTYSSEFAEIPLTLRIDRIDKLSNGELILIDYKSKKNCTPNDWDTDRPDEPQLPLYFATSEQLYAAIAFAQVNSQQCKYVGYSAEKNLTANVKIIKDWQQLKQQWHDVLTNLATAYKAGNVIVDPKNAATCNRCHLHILCRIHESTAHEQSL